MTLTLVEKAEKFAKEAHEGQYRKILKQPFITHPKSVAQTLAEAGLSEETVAAGFLHDVVEDTKFTKEDITREFGNIVAEIVSGNTEQKELSWEERKLHTIQSIPTSSREVICLIAADKLDNLRSLKREEETLGEGLWAKFKRGKGHQKWYFEGVVEALFKSMSVQEMPHYFFILEQEVKEFFEGVVIPAELPSHN